MPLTTLFRPMWLALGAMLLAVVLFAAPAAAQNPSGRNPTAESVNEKQLLDELQKIQGRVTIPDRKASLLEQPQGRDYRGFHERWLPWIGAILVLGMLILLAAVYLMKGRVRNDLPPAGVKIKRFNAFERFTHWMTATAFIILAITGLNYVFGKRILMPIIGADAFSAWTQWAKYSHNYVSWAFMLGVLLMIVLWIKDNFPDRYDAGWLRAGGGFYNRQHPPATRFNAGQKLMFWSVALGGIALAASGIIMLFPFSYADINGMQTAQYVHAIAGVIMVAIIIAHIYIGTLGMEGAYEAMGTGEVDLNWAREHHSVWVERQQAKTASGPQLPPHPAPAE